MPALNFYMVFDSGGCAAARSLLSVVMAYDARSNDWATPKPQLALRRRLCEIPRYP